MRQRFLGRALNSSMESPSTSFASSSMASTSPTGRRFLPPIILVLVHGNNGSPSDFLMMERVFYERFGVSSSSTSTSSFMQVDVSAPTCADALSPAIANDQSMDHAAALPLSGPPPTNNDETSGNNPSLADASVTVNTSNGNTVALDYESFDNVLVLRSSINQGKTSLGIAIGGRQLAQEIIDTILLKFDHNPAVKQYKLSIVAHSLGGLYARYACVQIMDALDEFHMEYTSFVTLCTPHLGVRKPRSNSTLGSMWRYSIHRVLSTSSLYGRTGIDLLGEVPRESIELNEQPVLQCMTEPDSLFLTCLRRFRFCTLVALTDGDLLVPYPTAAIVNRNPYPNHLLNGSFVEWKWTIRHFGFESSSAQVRAQLEAKVDRGIDCGDLELLAKRFLLLDEDRVLSDDGTDCDDKNQVEFSLDAARHLNTIPWRRIDLSVHVESVVGLLRLHDWPIDKNQIGDCKAQEFLGLMCDILGDDFQLPKNG